MENLTPRQLRILQILSRETMSYRGKTIAEELCISLRTLQIDIVSINKTLHEKLIFSNNLGYFLNTQCIQQHNLKFCNLKNDNELTTLIHKIMLDDHTWDVDELAEICYISTSTLSDRLKSIKIILKKNGLKLVKHKNKIWIEGKEFDKCRYINHLILAEATPLFLNLENCAEYFADMDIMRIKNFVLSAIEKYKCRIDNCYTENLYLNITISLSRMRKNYHMEIDHHMDIDANSIEYKIAQDICERYANHYSIIITLVDITFIATLIAGQIKPQITHEFEIHDVSTVNVQRKHDVNDILMRTFNYYMLNIDYEPFLYNFVLHVEALVIRAMHQQSVPNTIADTIKSTCPFIYDVAVYIAKELAEKYSITICDDEIAFISMHIGFVIESSTHENNRIRVLVICNDYHHSVDNILAKLKENYADKIDITNIITQTNLMHLETPSDLIISTIPIDIIGKRVISISPFYTMMDHLAIDQAINTCIKEIKIKREQQLLMSYFHESLFFRCTDLLTQDDVIHFLGKKIIDFGIAEDGFCESVKKRENLSSTCFFDLFAIPHAIELNAKKTMFCILINENGIEWGASKIKIVLMIAVQKRDRKSFMKIYNSIIQVLWSKEKVMRLVAVPSFTEFLECLKDDIPSNYTV